MANHRSPVTEQVQALLSAHPITCREVAQRLDIAFGHAQSVLRSIVHRGEARETTAPGGHGKKVAAFTLPKPIAQRNWERGEYTGEIRPLRYVPRDYAVITLGCIGVERSTTTPAGGAEAV